MNLSKVFTDGNPIYMAHVYYGDPNEKFSVELIKTLCNNGVDIIEFGIPFSDPVADGPIFQNACKRALEAGMTPKKAIEGIKKLRAIGIEKPIVVTSYYNVILHMGVIEFVKSISDAGANGLIIPNVPFEESDFLYATCEKYGINIIFLIAPTTQEERLKKILNRARGFVYIVAITGVTGVRDSIEDMTLNIVDKVRKYSNIPLLVGFGISKPEHVKAVVDAGANGFITGSAIGKIYEKYIRNPEDSLGEIKDFVRSLKHDLM